MRQTDIKTIYFSGHEVKESIVDFIRTRNPELSALVAQEDVQIVMNDDGMVIRIAREIESYNDVTEEYITNE